MNRKAQDAYLRFLWEGRLQNPVPLRDKAFNRIYAGHLRLRAVRAIDIAFEGLKEQIGRAPSWGLLAEIDDEYWLSLDDVGCETLREIKDFLSLSLGGS